MPIRPDLHQANRASWNAATAAHNSHKEGQAEFLRAGGTTLFAEEIELLGDLRGARLLHTLCNAGPDTLSLAARGASVTGVDISDEAIAYARRLSQESGIAGQFVRSDIYDFLAAAPAQRWDVVFISYGGYIWLSDLAAYMRGVARVLVPGGRFVMMEFHPFIQMFDERWNLSDPYSSGGEPIVSSEGVHDYVADSGDGLVPWGASMGVRDFRNPHACHQFNWSLADIFGAALRAGLRIERFDEYPHSNGCRIFADLVETEGRRFVCPPQRPAMPLMFGLVAARD